MSRRRVLSYVSYAACTYHDIEVEAKQSPFAQLLNLRPIHAGGPHRHIRDAEIIDHRGGCPDIVLALNRQRTVKIRSPHIIHARANGHGM